MRSNKFISIAEHNPELISEWHPELNGEQTPYNVSYGSAAKVWWICTEGHIWESSPNHRSRGRGCPQCSHIQRYITKRKNMVAQRGSLLDNNPELAKQWHPTKNGDLKPNDITSGTDERVWWQCEKGHEWDAPINSRNSGVNCPVCAGFRLSIGHNDLATMRPDIAKWWHPTKNGDLTPSDVKLHDDRLVWWQCPKGHEWEAKVIRRTGEDWCPVCKGRKVVAGDNDLATLMPKLALEWHPTKNATLTPQQVTLHSNKKVWWRCERGHEWQTAISHRSRGIGCPVCHGETKTSFPEQAIFFYLKKVTHAINRYMIDSRTEIDVYLPDYRIGIEYDGIYFHNSEKAIAREEKKQRKLSDMGITLFRMREIKEEYKENVVYAKPGASDSELSAAICELCNSIGRFIKRDINVDVDVSRDRIDIYDQYIAGEKDRSLAAINPQLASEWHPTKNGSLLPEYVSIRSNKKAWWQCKNGHEWQAVINSRSTGIGCPYCSGQKILTGYNDLATLNPTVASQWHPTRNGNRTPANVAMRSNKKAWWICEKGHEWEAVISDRSVGQNCPICINKKVLAGCNDLATTNPDLALQWHLTKNGTKKPTDFTAGSDKKAWWVCANGHEWEAAISSRNSGCGCPYCAGQRVITGGNDLQTLNPKLASEWHPTKNGDLLPCNVMPGANRKVWWLGKCGHEWMAPVVSRNDGRACPYCASQRILTGFNDLATLNTELAKEWHPTKNEGLTPQQIALHSNKKVWWQCIEGHEWQQSVNIRNRGNRCPYCAGQKVLIGVNDLATLNPKLASEWHPTKNGDLTPSDFMPGSNKKAWWICENGHEWAAVISSRNQGCGCMACHRAKRKQGNSK